MAASSYCTRSHAIAYFATASILAFIAITATLHSERSSSAAADSTSKNSVRRAISLGAASRTLRSSGFTITAAILRISPELFLSSPNSTIFAVQDSQISNAALPSHLLRDLLLYHTSPVRVSLEDLITKPQGFCLPTLYRNKSLAVTNIGKTVQINRVRISHPNLFLEGSVSIHGVLAPFAALNPKDDVIQAPDLCVGGGHNSTSSPISKVGGGVEWSRVIRTLTSKGYLSFAIGLHRVLDGLLEEQRAAEAVTILVPPRLQMEAYHHRKVLLEKIVMFHVVPQRLTHRELSALPVRTLLKTMAHGGQPLEVIGVMSFEPGLIINGVRIVTPDVYTSERLVVHGISRAFEVSDLPNTALEC